MHNHVTLRDIANTAAEIGKDSLQLSKSFRICPDSFLSYKPEKALAYLFATRPDKRPAIKKAIGGKVFTLYGKYLTATDFRIIKIARALERNEGIRFYNDLEAAICLSKALKIICKEVRHDRKPRES